MYQKLQQSVGPIYTVDNFIHVLHRSFTKLLHHEEHIDEESTENLAETETDRSMDLFINERQRMCCIHF